MMTEAFQSTSQGIVKAEVARQQGCCSPQRPGDPEEARQCSCLEAEQLMVSALFVFFPPENTTCPLFYGCSRMLLRWPQIQPIK